MLNYKIEAKEKIAIKNFVKMRLIDLMADERHFTIFVDGQMFINDSCLLAREFVAYAFEWLKNPEREFVYNSIDDEENPFLAFRIVEGGWKLESVWQEFVCDNIFSDDEVKNFINEIISQVVY